MSNHNFTRLSESCPTYSDMIHFCCDDGMVMNNDIVGNLSMNGFFFEVFTGSEFIDESEEDYKEIYQYYIISERDAERLAEYTNELVLWNEGLGLYVLCVTHCGTGWKYVSANWKEDKEEEAVLA